MIRAHASRSAQALLLVMWAMFMMSFSIIGLIQLLRLNVTGSAALERSAIASSLAMAGITMGRNSEFPVDGILEEKRFKDGGQIEVRAVSETSKLNINKTLAAENRLVLRTLFRDWGLGETDTETVIDSLLDYVEPGDQRRLNGAKRKHYLAANRPPPPGRDFLSVNEMESVLNFDLVTARNPAWRDFFTIYGNGQLDLSTAHPDLIRAVCGVGDSGARGVLRARSATPSTLVDTEAARIALGLTTPEFEEISGQISVGGQIRRVTAKGVIGPARRSIETIVQVGDAGSTILDWREW